MNVRLSSYKHDFGINELLSIDMTKYWHTDDNLPHFIEITFKRKTYVEEVQIFLSFTEDDSYTPELLEIWSGLTRETVKQLQTINAIEPEGMVVLPVGHECFYIYVLIRANHQEGRDSHIRHVKVINQNRKEIYHTEST
ncbi:hypothetical protein BDAP_001091 [Binucleata daphniae]